MRVLTFSMRVYSCLVRSVGLVLLPLISKPRPIKRMVAKMPPTRILMMRPMPAFSFLAEGSGRLD